MKKKLMISVALLAVLGAAVVGYFHFSYKYVIISYGYDDRIIDLYKDDFFIISLKRTNPLSQTEGSTFRELIITNYDPSPHLNKQLDIFGQATEAMWEPVILHRPRRILKAD